MNRRPKQLCPEMPLKRPDSDQWENVDFVLFSSDLTRAFLIMLKMRLSLRSKRQDDFLKRIAARGFKSIVEGVKHLAQYSTPDDAPRYFHLLYALQDAGFVELPDVLMRQVEGCETAEFPRNWRILFEQVRVLDADPDVSVVYIQPEATEGECITFDNVARHLAQFDDEFSTQFARSVVTWKKEPGSKPPA